MRVLDSWQTSLSFRFTNTFWQKEGTKLHLLLNTDLCISFPLLLKLLDLTETVSRVDQNIYSSELSKLKAISLQLLDVKVGTCRARCAWAVFENIPAPGLC